MIKTVGIIGHGAIGVLYATIFQKVLGNDLFIIADEDRIQRYQNEGVYANGEKCSFQYVSYEEAAPVDLLIFDTKYTGLETAASLAGSAVGKDTIVMSFLNGLVSEQVIEEKLHPAHLLYCTVQGMDTTKTGNQVTFRSFGSVTFGSDDNSKTPDVLAVEELFGRSGIIFSVPADIHHQLWNKWMLNVGVNQACAVYATGYGGVQAPGEPRETMIAAMEEARATAAAEGVNLTEKERDDWIALIDSLSPDGEPSMRQDTRAGRPTEVELFAGMVLKLGKIHGIAVPQNEKFYQILSRS